MVKRQQFGGSDVTALEIGEPGEQPRLRFGWRGARVGAIELVDVGSGDTGNVLDRRVDLIDRHWLAECAAVEGVGGAQCVSYRGEHLVGIGIRLDLELRLQPEGSGAKILDRKSTRLNSSHERLSR